MELKGIVADSKSGQAAPDVTAETSQTSNSEKPEHRTTESLQPNSTKSSSSQTRTDPKSISTQQLTEPEKRSATASEGDPPSDTCYSVLIVILTLCMFFHVLFQPTVDHPGRWSSRQKHDYTQFLSQWILFAHCNQHFHFSHNCFSPIPTLLKIKVHKRFFKRYHRKNIFGSTKNYSVKGALKNISFLPFYNLKNLLSTQRSFCETERFFRC